MLYSDSLHEMMQNAVNESFWDAHGVEIGPRAYFDDFRKNSRILIFSIIEIFFANRMHLVLSRIREKKRFHYSTPGVISEPKETRVLHGSLNSSRVSGNAGPATLAFGASVVTPVHSPLLVGCEGNNY